MEVKAKVKIQAREMADAFLNGTPDEQAFFMVFVGREIGSKDVGVLAMQLKGLSESGESAGQDLIEQMHNIIEGVS
jgi:hypothetical protein